MHIFQFYHLADGSDALRGEGETIPTRRGTRSPGNWRMREA